MPDRRLATIFSRRTKNDVSIRLKQPPQLFFGATLQIDKNPFHGETIDEQDAYVIAAALAAAAAWR